MPSDAGTHRLGSLTCRERLQAAKVGRLAWCEDDQPVVVPVNYAMHGDLVFIRTGSGSKAAAAARGGRVSLQIDDLHGEHAPWSVLAKGTATLVAELDEEEAYGLDLRPEAGTMNRDLFIRIELDEYTGRELDGFGRVGR